MLKETNGFVKRVIKDVNFECAIGLVYMPYNSDEKRRLWEGLIEARRNLDGPCLIMEYFNDILKAEERKGNSMITRNMIEFGEWVSEMNLIELPIVGRKYT